MLDIFFLVPFLFRPWARDFLFSNQTRGSDGPAKEIAREIAFSRDRIILVSSDDLCCDVAMKSYIFYYYILKTHGILSTRD